MFNHKSYKVKNKKIIKIETNKSMVILLITMMYMETSDVFGILTDHQVSDPLSHEVQSHILPSIQMYSL